MKHIMILTVVFSLVVGGRRSVLAYLLHKKKTEKGERKGRRNKEKEKREGEEHFVSRFRTEKKIPNISHVFLFICNLV